MPRHEIEIEIRKDGQVRVHIKGAKGKSCLTYARLLQEIVGKLKDQRLTSEYYEPDEKARIDARQEQAR